MKKLLLVIALLGYSLDAQNTAKSVPITNAEEIAAGQILAEEFSREEGLQSTPQTKRIDAYLQSVGDRVSAHAQRDLPYRFHFDPSPAFKSAIGLPGGQIFIGGGILAYMDSEDQVAAVLGHEIEHIALNHCRDRLVKLLSEQHLSVENVKQLKIDDFVANYGHDKELAADREGVKLAIEAGYSSNAAIRLLQTFLILDQQRPNASPEGRMRLEERIAQIKSLADARKPAPADTPLVLP